MIALLILAPWILLAALGAVWNARPVHAALMLALALALNAILYLVMGADFIGLIQFMVYVGAVAVLIVFSLLITRPGDESEERKRRPGNLLPGLLCTLPVLGILLFMVSKTVPFQPVTSAPNGLSIEEIGITLFTQYAPAVMAVGVLLTAVMVGAALFARETGGKSEPSSRS